MWKGQLQIRVDSATDLKEADWTGGSDPYCVVSLTENGKQVAEPQRTKTINGKLNPKWKEEFFFTASHCQGPVTIKFEVFDEDNVGTDDFLGQYSLVVAPDDPNVLWDKLQCVPVQIRKKGEDVTGKLNFSVSYISYSKRERQTFDPNDFFKFPDGKPTNVLVGPILHFRGVCENRWGIGMVVAVDGPGGETPDLSIKPAPHDKNVVVTKLLTEGTRTVFVYDSAYAQGDAPFRVTYTLNGKENSFLVPAIGEPLRLTGTSCNGFHNPAEKVKLKNEEFFMWKVMNDEHKKEQFHLILQGGDQVYADPLFTSAPSLASKKIEPGNEAGGTLPYTPEMDAEVATFYMDLYIKSWKGPHISTGLASIPSIMMWDDHDIFDGWGSYDAKLLNSAIYQGIFKQAEKFYCAFQLGCTLEKLPPATLPGNHRGKSQVYVIGRTAILAADLRTERSIHQVMHSDTYVCLSQWFSQKRELDHLIVISSIPMIYNDFSTIESAIRGSGAEIEDDLLDHWRSADHAKERYAFLRQLLDFAYKNNTRVTLLSGDVHIGALGCVVDKRHSKQTNTASINCLISSAIVNVPPPTAAVDLLVLNAGVQEKIDTHIRAGLVRIPPEKQVFYVRGRNFLELIFTESKGVFCKWIAEGELHKNFSFYIKPPTAGAKPDLKLQNEGAMAVTFKATGETIKGWFH